MLMNSRYNFCFYAKTYNEKRSFSKIFDKRYDLFGKNSIKRHLFNKFR